MIISVVSLKLIRKRGKMRKLFFSLWSALTKIYFDRKSMRMGFCTCLCVCIRHGHVRERAFVLPRWLPKKFFFDRCSINNTSYTSLYTPPKVNSSRSNYPVGGHFSLLSAWPVIIFSIYTCSQPYSRLDWCMGIFRLRARLADLSRDYIEFLSLLNNKCKGWWFNGDRPIFSCVYFVKRQFW